MARSGVVWMAWVLLALSTYAQASRPRFEVASVKPTMPPTGGPLTTVLNAIPRVRPGLFTAPQITVESLIFLAHDVRANRLVGSPSWGREEYFQITAKAADDTPTEQVKLMIRSLLWERFNLALHSEQREMRYQALVRARSDGALGPSLLPIKECNSTVVSDLRQRFPETYPAPIGAGVVGNCSKTGVIELARYLEDYFGGLFNDETGLTSSYYFTLRSQRPAGQMSREVSDPGLPSLPTALKEQLGLKVEMRRGLVEVLVIDSIQRPTEN